jgi:phospholipid/cholesterol/gamma-HCH transport system substrate-binding protein
MTFKFKYTDKIVGLFIILSLFLLLIASILILFNQKIFTKKFYFFTQFSDAEGLKINKEIIFKGFKIGKIKKIDLNRENFVNVEFYIYGGFIDKIKEDSVINKASNPITGSTLMFIPNIRNTRIADEYSYIPSLDTKEGEMLITLGEVEKQADSISNIIDNIDIFLASLNSDHNASDNSIARILVNSADIVESIRNEMENIDQILYNIKILSRRIRNPDGLVRRMLDPDGEIMFNAIQSSLDNLEIMMAELTAFSQFINGQSKQIETLLLEGKMTMEEAQDVIEGIKNNPLIRGGIEEKKEQEIIKESIRDRDF